MATFSGSLTTPVGRLWLESKSTSRPGRRHGCAEVVRGVGPRTVRPGSPRLKAAFGAATRLGFAKALTRGPLPGLGRESGQGLRPRPGGARPSADGWVLRSGRAHSRITVRPCCACREGFSPFALDAVALALTVAALVRPYADNQRNWMVVAAVITGLAALALLASSSLGHGLGHFWRTLRSEWSNDSRGGLLRRPNAERVAEHNVAAAAMHEPAWATAVPSAMSSRRTDARPDL